MLQLNLEARQRIALAGPIAVLALMGASACQQQELSVIEAESTLPTQESGLTAPTVLPSDVRSFDQVMTTDATGKPVLKTYVYDATSVTHYTCDSEAGCLPGYKRS